MMCAVLSARSGLLDPAKVVNALAQRMNGPVP
jgi:hypothetical protein